MSERGSSSLVRWLVALGLVALGVGLLVWRLGGAGKPPVTPVMLACDACDFSGQADVPVGFDQWPFPCPKCQKPAAAPARPCPNCGKLLAWNPAKPPTACRFCKAPLKDNGDD